MPALVALENTCLQIFDGMRGSPSQMRIAATLITAKRCFSTRALDPVTARMRSLPAILGVGAALPVPVPDQVTIIRLEDGEERAPSTAFAN